MSTEEGPGATAQPKTVEAAEVIRAYERGRRDAAWAIEEYVIERRRGFLWAQKAIELALGSAPRRE